MTYDNLDPWHSLRKRAEALLDSEGSSADNWPEADVHKLAHDLAVHQVELEIQNEELQAAHQRIDAALARYAQLYHQAPVGFLTLDVNGIILQCNQTFLEMLGESVSSLAGTSLAALLESPGREIFLSRYRAIYNAPEGKRLDVRLKRKVQGVMDIRLTSRLDPGPSPSVPGGATGSPSLLVAVHDISAEKAADLAWRTANQLNEQIIHCAGEGIVVHGPDLRYRVWNPYMEQLTGKAAFDVLGRHPLEVFPFLREAGVMERLEKSVRGQDVDPVDFPFEIPGTGKSGWASDHSTALRGVDGDIVGVIATVRDITERKANELELQRMNRLYDMLSQLGQCLTTVKDRQQLLQDVCSITVQRGGFQLAWVGWVDPVTSMVMPLAMAGDVVGYLDGLSMAIDDRPEGQGPTGTCIRENSIYVCQDVLADPTTIPWRERASRFKLRGLVAVPLSFQGQVVGALMIYSQDANVFQKREVILLEEIGRAISFGLEHLAATEARKALAAQTLRAEKNESLSILAQGMAHDYNNLLQAILFSVEAAAAQVTPGSPPEVTLSLAQRYTGMAQQLGKQLTTLAGMNDRSDTTGPLKALIVSILHDVPDLEGIQVISHFPAELPPVNYHHERLWQAIEILLDNAWEAMPQGGTLVIECTAVAVKAEDVTLPLKAGSYCQLSFQDSGPGIAPEDLPRVFDPYFSSKPLGTIKGQGLSLALCRSILLSHGGLITAESQPGQGARFTLFLPAAPASET